MLQPGLAQARSQVQILEDLGCPWESFRMSPVQFDILSKWQKVVLKESIDMGAAFSYNRKALLGAFFRFLGWLMCLEHNK